MSAKGSAIIDFGAFPGTDIATLAITGQSGILSTSSADAYLNATATDTTAHSSDEHLVAQIDVRCSAIVAGTGFTINAISREEPNYGTFNVTWIWA